MTVIENPERFEIEIKGDEQIIEPFNFMKNKSEKSSLIILNQKFDGIKFIDLWHNTNIHICADGGANQLYNHWSTENQRRKFIPHFIVGDLDSLSPMVRDYYESQGTRVIPQYTQYSSDFMKSMTLALLCFSDVSLDNVNDHDGLEELVGQITHTEDVINTYVLCGLGGRFDQSMHAINQTIILRSKHPNLKVIFVNQVDIAFFLNKGRNLVQYDSIGSFYKGGHFPALGMLPFTTNTINSYGLRWDVRDWKSSMSGHVSSNNGVMGSNGFIIECDGELVVNIEYNCFHE